MCAQIWEGFLVTDWGSRTFIPAHQDVPLNYKIRQRWCKIRERKPSLQRTHPKKGSKSTSQLIYAEAAAHGLAVRDPTWGLRVLTPGLLPNTLTHMHMHNPLNRHSHTLTSMETPHTHIYSHTHKPSSHATVALRGPQPIPVILLHPPAPKWER